MSDIADLKAKVAQFEQRDDIADLLAEGGVGIELGVAEGYFSRKILERSKLEFLYSVDMYAGDRGHDVAQYRKALETLAPYRARNMLIKMRFDEALPLFPDDYFDFIYIDGYAHTGEESGKTFFDWFPKLKVGGIFAGDDYDPQNWPQVVSAVDGFVACAGLDMMVIEQSEEARRLNGWSRSPTWLAVKTDDKPVVMPEGGLKIPEMEMSVSNLMRKVRRRLKRMTEGAN